MMLQNSLAVNQSTTKYIPQRTTDVVNYKLYMTKTLHTERVQNIYTNNSNTSFQCKIKYIQILLF